jgi:hypothetical protein
MLGMARLLGQPIGAALVALLLATSRGLSDAQVQLISGRLLHQFILTLFAATLNFRRAGFSETSISPSAELIVAVSLNARLRFIGNPMFWIIKSIWSLGITLRITFSTW